jgi:hypothetical protein
MTNPSTQHRPIGGRRLAERPVEPTTGVTDAPLDPATARRDQVLTAAWLGVIAGIWLIIAPFVLGYGDSDPYWNDIVFGAAVVVLSGIRLAARGTQAAGWLMALAGAWIFASAFWLDSTGTATWNDVILGIIVFCLGAGAAASIRRRR